jgi:hypothetical protein
MFAEGDRKLAQRWSKPTETIAAYESETYLMQHMPYARNDFHLKFPLHLSYHKFFIKTIGAREDE